MTNLACAPALAACGDQYIAGLNWSKREVPKQTIIGLSEDEARTLAAAGRIDRVTKAGGGKTARACLLPAAETGSAPRCLLHGSESALQAMKAEIAIIVNKDAALKFPIHPHDTSKLRKPTTRANFAEIERETGCRVIVEDQRKAKLADAILTPRQHRIYLCGDNPSQAQAMAKIAPMLQHTDAPLQETTLTSDYEKACGDWLSWKSACDSKKGAMELFFHRTPDVVSHSRMEHLCELHLTHNDSRNVSVGSPNGFFGFSRELTGDGLAISDDNLATNAVLRQRYLPNGRDRAPLQGLVTASKGQILPFVIGPFFAFEVVKMDTERKSRSGPKSEVKRGGTRLGVTVLPPEAPVPMTLLSKPRESWVLGRGFARGRNGKVGRLEAADIDSQVVEGDQLGVLVTRSEGSLVLLRRSARNPEWECIVNWPARIDHTQRCFALLELSGAITEIKLVRTLEPPESVARAPDEVRWSN